LPKRMTAERPLYMQIKEEVEDMILDGRLREEEQIPSTTDMVHFYKLNHITIAKGVNRLVEEGVLYKQRGIGVFVAKGAKERLFTKRKASFKKDYIEPLLEEAKRLGIKKDTIKDMLAEGEE